MSQLDQQILDEFLTEAQGLIDNMLETLEGIEGDFSQIQKLQDYANQVDRIMGGAKSLALMVDKTHALHLISDYTALCKAVGYKASQIKNNPQFYDICVALLLDASETLNLLLKRLDQPADQLKKQFSNTFLERLHWVSDRFSADVSATVSSSHKSMDQDSIDELMKKLGL